MAVHWVIRVLNTELWGHHNFRYYWKGKYSGLLAYLLSGFHQSPTPESK